MDRVKVIQKAIQRVKAIRIRSSKPRATAAKSAKRRVGWALGVFVAALLLAACERTVEPGEAAILDFAASPRTVRVGEALAFSWRTQGTTACRLEVSYLVSYPDAGEREAPSSYPLESCAEGEQQHHARAAGRLQAELIIADAAGEERSSVLQGLEVQEGVRAAFRATPTGDPLTFIFDASASAGASAFSWRLGDGTEAQGAQVTHRYATPGRYTVTLSVSDEGGRVDSASQVVTPARERVVLFDGGDLSAWRRVRGGEANWPVQSGFQGGFAEVRPGGGVGANSLRTEGEFGDFRLYLEFWVPETPPGTREQARGNSGVYLQGRYELQILDSYGVTLRGADDAGAIYGVKDADENASRPAESWQSYDVTFRAARWDGNTKLEDARVSLVWNGVLVHDQVRLPGSTQLGVAERPGGGPIVLQDHGSRVRFRNIWLEPL